MRLIIFFKMLYREIDHFFQKWIYEIDHFFKMLYREIDHFFKMDLWDCPKIWAKKWHPHGDSNPGCRDENPVS